MKKGLLFILALMFVVTGESQGLRCLTAAAYSKITNGGNPVKVNRPISICFNDYCFSFYTPETGTRTFRIDANTIDTLPGGYARQRFINEENETNMRGDYSIEIDYEKQKTVVINFARFGEAYVAQAPRFAGSMVNAKGAINWDKEVSKAKHADSLRAANQAPVAKLDEAWKENYNPINPRWLADTICSRISRPGQFAASFIVRIDKAGIVTGVTPENTLPASYEPYARLVYDAAMGLKIEPFTKGGMPFPSYTQVHISLR